jgi:hypothetical protein
MINFTSHLGIGCGFLLGSCLVLLGSSQLTVPHLWAVLIALTMLLFNLLSICDEVMRYIRSLADYLWPAEAVAPIILPSIPASRPLGPVYAPFARRLSPGYSDMPPIFYERDFAVSPSPLCSVLLFEPVHVWSLRPIFPHIAPLALCPSLFGEMVDSSLANHVNLCPILHRCQSTPMFVRFLEASLLDRLNFDIPTLLCNCPRLPCASSNNVRNPLRGDLLKLKLLLKMKVGSHPPNGIDVCI